MKRSLVATLWIGTVATAFALALQLSGQLARPAAWLADMMAAPNQAPGFGT